MIWFFIILIVLGILVCAFVDSPQTLSPQEAARLNEQEQLEDQKYQETMEWLAKHKRDRERRHKEELEAILKPCNDALKEALHKKKEEQDYKDSFGMV
jgi:predicted Holliday junction resolvase-like endonuclease